MSTQVLEELYVSLAQGKTPITTSEVAERAVGELSRYSVVHVDPPLVFAAIQANEPPGNTPGGAALRIKSYLHQ